MDSAAAKRFIISSLWEADKEGSPAGSKKADRGSREGESASKQGSARKKRRVDTE